MTNILTPSQTSGPLFGFSLIHEDLRQSVSPDDPQALKLTGKVFDCNQDALKYEAFVEAWSPGQATRARTMGDGTYEIWMKKPQAQTMPNGRFFAPHLHIALFARGLARQLITRLYFPDEAEANDADPVLSLLSPEQRSGLTARADQDNRSLIFDIRLQGDQETVFFRLDD